MGTTTSRRALLAIAVLAVLALLGPAAVGARSEPHVAADTPIEAGRYLVIITGCNHCHTEGWQNSDGTVPESQWLRGGHAPPNIPTPNLRAVLGALPQAAFIRLFRTKQPPSQMPFFNFRTLSDQDLIAIYTFIRQLK